MKKKTDIEKPVDLQEAREAAAEDARHESRFLKSGEEQFGWSFVWGTQCGFVSDADILKRMPRKDWDVYGR